MVSDPPPPRLQPLTRARVKSLGAQGSDWQRRLPRLLAELAQRWRLRLGRPLPGGSNSYVCLAVRAGGSGAEEPVVLKVSLPGEDLSLEAETLRRADGRGYVALLDVDQERNALLLEALGPSLQAQPGPIEDQLARLADTLALAWRAPTTFPELDPRPRKATGLIELITGHWVQLGHPCPEVVIERALAEAAWLAEHEAAKPVVVHGDPHPQNLLRVPSPRPGAETGYCFVDPSSSSKIRAMTSGSRSGITQSACWPNRDLGPPWNATPRSWPAIVVSRLSGSGGGPLSNGSPVGSTSCPSGLSGWPGPSSIRRKPCWTEPGRTAAGTKSTRTNSRQHEGPL